mmetsp:Transcript_63457/g.143132  ORF Transcript_63457/g.143132 Transcript_63457/m.143132 type:complete len:168 (-) Transcript_63457:343-846(-)
MYFQNGLVLTALFLGLTSADDPLLDVAYDGPPGWRMVDRFAGFRYEIFGHVQGVGFRKAAAATAEELGCFGWAQNTAHGTVVGEARCAKVMAPQMEDWLSNGPEGARVDAVSMKAYENTKIKLHFSHFKILPDDRETCFLDEPHQCPEYRQNAASGAETTQSQREEL